MYVCMYVYMHVCVCVCVYTYIYIYKKDKYIPIQTVLVNDSVKTITAASN